MNAQETKIRRPRAQVTCRFRTMAIEDCRFRFI